MDCHRMECAIFSMLLIRATACVFKGGGFDITTDASYSLKAKWLKMTKFKVKTCKN